jgi:L-rhamnose mutarotase
MNQQQWLAALLILTGAAVARGDEAKDTRCFELRVYTAAPGKLEALHARFRDHTCKLFEKHGITNVGYWVPLDNAEQKLYYILAYPDRKARNASWAGFMSDPAWKAAWAASEKDGKLVTKVESTFLHATDYSPTIAPAAAKEKRIFELRTYTTTLGNLSRLNDRFRGHTMALFAKHGMTNLAYWMLDDGQKGADETLLYMLAHPSKDAREARFQAFRDDAAWKSVREASEKAAGGPLTVTDGVKFVLLEATDYSPTK